MTTEQKQDFFEGYLHNTLTRKQRTEFEALLEADAPLKEEYLTFQKTVRLVQRIGLRDEVGAIVDANAKPSVRRYLGIAGIAAAAAIVATIYFFSGSPTDQELIDTWYSPYPNVVSMRGNELNEGLDAYSAGNFRDALLKLQQTPNRSDTTLFYEGICHIALAQPQDAIRAFRLIPETSTFQQQITWYLALASIQSGDREAAVSYLTSIRENEFHFKESRELLNDLH